MKDDLLNSLCMLLAGSRYSDSEIRGVLDMIVRRGPTNTLSQVRRYRAVLMNSEPEDNTQWRQDPSSLIDDPLGQVEHLLRGEAALPAGLAAELLTKELRLRGTLIRTKLPTLGKSGFRDWLRKLSRDVPFGELMHVATVIRNRAIHSPTEAWPLKGAK